MSTTLRPPPGTTPDPLYPDSDGKPMGETEYHILAITHLYEPRLQGFQLVAGVYVPMKSHQSERLSSQELGLDLVIDAHLLRVVDPKTRRRLPTSEEYQEQLKSARREARKAKRATADAKRRAEVANRHAEVAKRRAEIAERHAAEVELREAEAQRKEAEAKKEAESQRRRAAALEAEMEQLRDRLKREDQS